VAEHAVDRGFNRRRQLAGSALERSAEDRNSSRGGSMMRTFKVAVASVAIGGLLLPAAAIAGGTLSRADFERCNQQAMQVAGISDSQSPAASPSTSGTGGSSSGSMSTSPSGTSGTSSTPSVSGSTSTPSTSGSTSTPSASGSSAGGATGGSYGSGSSASGSSAQSGSMASSADQEKIDKAVQAYRDCLQK
jgi:hypothetical protein